MNPSMPALQATQGASDFADEGALVYALKTGDEAAFTYLVKSYGPQMLATARRIARDEDTAREALQDAFLSAHKNIHRFERRSALSTWLHRVVVNAALMKLRAKKRLEECSIDELLPQFDGLGYLIGPSSMSSEPVDQMMERRAVCDMVRQGIESLPDSYRAILVLRDIEGFDTAEAAKLLGISTGAAKVRLHRARLALKKLLEPVFQGELP
jgi:RNA polymerase sigma-70 factor (ECF subfamily)